MKTIKLEPGAFNEELLRHVGIGKVGWDSEDHQKLVKSIFPRLRDEENKNADLNEAQRNILELILRPTEELQSKVLKQLFEAAGCRLDDEALATYELLFNGVQFADYLYKTNNPATNQPFVVKPAPKGKKATLNKLLAQKVEPKEPTPETVEAVVETTEQ